MFTITPIEGGVCAAPGFRAGGYHAGLKSGGALDVGYIYMESPCEVSALFTSNAFKAAPLRHFLASVKGKKSNFILVNTKNANAMTGVAGIADVEAVLGALCERFPAIQNPIMSSTGVIGVRLPVAKITESLSQINLDSTAPDDFATAIKTTDAFEKQIALRVELEGGATFSIGAAAKGAGMIAPSLATMLCFITTDAALPLGVGEKLLAECAESSFNAISVDGDMSTNDSVFLCASGESGAWDEAAFGAALRMVMEHLASEIVRDGEGSSKVAAFEVTGAASYAQAKAAAKALSNSLLVKTALFGCDPNWGRIASTIGAAAGLLGVKTSEESLSIFIGGVRVYGRGEIFFDAETETKCAEIMKGESFKITCDLGAGEHAYTALACDLGHEYVKINADYRS